MVYVALRLIDNIAPGLPLAEVAKEYASNRCAKCHFCDVGAAVVLEWRLHLPNDKWWLYSVFEK